VIVVDQGYGDCFQFGRFIHKAAQYCEDISVACSPELEGIVKRFDGVKDTFTDWTKTPMHTVHARLTSLPDILGLHTPEDIAYNWKCIKPLPASCENWFSLMGPAEKTRVGLVWSGRTTHPNNNRRSMSTDVFLGGLEEMKDEVQFVSLQKPCEDTRYALDFTNSLTDFDATAGLISHLDLVVGIDTGIIHLASAMGKPAWVLVPFAADWRWGFSGDKCDWYPNVRIFRQPKPGDWASVFKNVKEALRGFKPTAY